MNLTLNYLIIKHVSTLLRIAANDILYIEADGNYSVIHLIDGSTETVAHNLKEIEELMFKTFTKEVLILRVCRSLFVNFKYIYLIDGPRQRLVLVSPDLKKTQIDLSIEQLKKMLAKFNLPEPGTRTSKTYENDL